MGKSTNKKTSKCWVYGIHPVRELLLSNRVIYKVLINRKIKHKFEHDTLISQLFREYHDVIELVDQIDFDKYLAKKVIHQGIAILVDPPRLYSFDDFVSDITNQKEKINKVAILDRITDVGNIGAIIRSAAAFGIKYLFIPEYNAFSDYGVLTRASAGMIERIKIIQIVNINNLLKDLKKYDFWCLGLSLNGKHNLSLLPKMDRIAIILGNEHKGIRPLIEKNCDMLVSIPMADGIESLNVSSSAAIIFHKLYYGRGT